MARAPGLFAYLSLAALNAPAARRRIAGEIARGGPEAARLAERLGQPGQRRPDGHLIWLHASGAGEEGALLDLARRLGERHPRAAFLFTTDLPPARPSGLPARVFHQYVPHEASSPVAAFLDHWRPDIGLWAGLTLRPALIIEAAERGTAMALIDATSGQINPRNWARLIVSTLRAFDRVLATDERARDALIEAGAEETMVEIAGPLQEDARALPCNLAERNSIGEVLSTRPVWLAVAVTEGEEEAVIAAHRRAVRLAHRLMLILVPQNPARGPALAQKLSDEGFDVALRSGTGEPERSTDIFVADSEGDLGLWYRLAPLTFMGGTLDTAGSGGRSPLEAAALGSAILHGPGTGPHASTYARFTEAAAARLVTGAAELGEALSELLSPDKAAGMASAAWRVSTGGAELTERVIALVGETLVQRASA
jgi:3-deoxy-D-manno-octulosonic-acid transferase